MPTFTPPTRALPLKTLRAAVRAALLADGTVAGLVGTRIYPDDDVAGGLYPLITVAVASAVPDYDYTSSRLNALVDVVAADKSTSAVNVETLGDAAQAALVDGAWTIGGYDLVECLPVSIRPYTDLVDGIVFRYQAVSVRVTATKQ